MTEKELAFKLSEMTVAQLIQANQGLGRDLEHIRDQRKELQRMIVQRFDNGEREHQEQAETATDGVSTKAPGAVIKASAK